MGDMSVAEECGEIAAYGWKDITGQVDLQVFPHCSTLLDTVFSVIKRNDMPFLSASIYLMYISIYAKYYPAGVTQCATSYPPFKMASTPALPPEATAYPS